MNIFCYKHDIEKILYFYKTFGFVIIKDFFEKKQIKNTKNEILNIVKK